MEKLWVYTVHTNISSPYIWARSRHNHLKTGSGDISTLEIYSNRCSRTALNEKRRHFVCAIQRKWLWILSKGCHTFQSVGVVWSVAHVSRKHGAIARKKGHRAFSHRDFHQRLMASAGVEGCRQVGLEAAWIRRLPRVSSKDQLGLFWSEALNIPNFDRLWSVWPLISASTYWLRFSRLLAVPSIAPSYHIDKASDTCFWHKCSLLRSDINVLDKNLFYQKP